MLPRALRPSATGVVSNQRSHSRGEVSSRPIAPEMGRFSWAIREGAGFGGRVPPSTPRTRITTHRRHHALTRPSPYSWCLTKDWWVRRSVA